jgi:hypothetical protein
MELESENKVLKEKIIPLLENLKPVEKDYYEKSMELNKKISDLNLIYHQLISQKSVLKLESEVIINYCYVTIQNVILDSTKENFKKRRKNKNAE